MSSNLIVNNIEVGAGATIYTAASNTLTFGTNGYERVRIDTGGRVLIGTDTQGLATGDELVVATSNHTGMTIRSGSSHEGNIFFGDADYGAAGIIRYDHSDNSMQFKTNSQGQEKLRITSAGRVGINTNNPDGFLEVYNSSVSGNTVLKIHNDKTGDAAQLRLEGGRTSTLDFGQVLFSNRGYVNAVIQANGSADDGALLFKTSAIGSGNGLSSYFQIASNGNIKLGNNAHNAPGARFHLEDSNNTDYNKDATNGAVSEYFINVGTGDCTGILLQNTSTNATNTCQASIHSVAEGTSKDTALTFGTRQNSDATLRERMRIGSTGKVGIGITNPAEKFEVSGGNVAIVGGSSYKIDTHPLVSYASFSEISGGSYAARLGSTGSSTIRSTQIYGGGGHIATFDGVNTRLGINKTVPTKKLDIHTSTSADGIRIRSTGNTYNELSFDANRTGATNHIGRIISSWNGTAVSYISMDTGSDTTNKDDGMIRFWTANGSGNFERLRINSDGKINIGTLYSASTTYVDVRFDETTTYSATSNHVNGLKIFNDCTTDNGFAGIELAATDGDDYYGSTLLKSVADGTNYSNDFVIQTRHGGNYGERLRIDSTGYITTPNQPCFHVSLEGHKNATQDPLVFTDVRVNTGSHYSSSTGKFTAPVAGRYFFFFGGIKNSNNNQVTRVYVRKNNSSIYDSFHCRMQEEGNYANGSIQWIISLAVNDTIHLRLDQGGLHASEYTQFGGYLIG